MSYVDAIFNKGTDQIQVVERDKDGNRRFVDHPARYVLYYEDPRGKFRSIYGEQLNRVSTNQQKVVDIRFIEITAFFLSKNSNNRW